MRPWLLSRRGVLLGCLAVVLPAGVAGCRRNPAPRADRCPLCGMKIDPTSPWRALLVESDGREVAFDTPRCALAAWRRGKVAARALRAQEFYSRAWTDGEALRFAVGSDVTGPMGPDFVPVAAEQVEKFAKDHGAQATYPLSAITREVIEQAP